MNRYQVTKQLGDGTYGSVLKAINRQTGEVVSVWHCDSTLIPLVEILIGLCVSFDV